MLGEKICVGFKLSIRMASNLYQKKPIVGVFISKIETRLLQNSVDLGVRVCHDCNVAEDVKCIEVSCEMIGGRNQED